ncbi:E3 ubiquitin-protein ligase At4g11680-like [Silene latifolia]|uniref:E3 ubiquitin-protein ligase At4g11680-like n=1 Tax=Silene latifolia TaxID=37657 RepID=UPI003D77C1A9
MAVQFTTLAAILCRLLCMSDSFAPIREPAIRDMEDFAYSKKAVTVEIIVNIVIVLLSVVLLVCTAAENPNVPLRVWVAGYALHCLIHVSLVWFEYRRLARRRELELQLANAIANYAVPGFNWSVAHHCNNLSVSFNWLNVGLRWLNSGDKLLQQNAPRLYWWVNTIYTSYDDTFCLIWVTGIAACCCVACFSATPTYRVRTVAEQQGAFEEDLNVLPKYRFHMSRNLEKPNVVVPMNISSEDRGAEHVLLHEDSQCSICLCSYDDGIELDVLPCDHHFHVTCIEEWLKINPTCPVCNYGILKERV